MPLGVAVQEHPTPYLDHAAAFLFQSTCGSRMIQNMTTLHVQLEFKLEPNPVSACVVQRYNYEPICAVGRSNTCQLPHLKLIACSSLAIW